MTWLLLFAGLAALTLIHLIGGQAGRVAAVVALVLFIIGGVLSVA